MKPLLHALLLHKCVRRPQHGKPPMVAQQLVLQQKQLSNDFNNKHLGNKRQHLVRADSSPDVWQEHVGRSPYLVSRTADTIRRQAQRELEQEKALQQQFQQAVDLKDHYFGNRQVHPTHLIYSLALTSLFLVFRSAWKVPQSSIIRVFSSNVPMSSEMRSVYRTPNFKNNSRVLFVCNWIRSRRWRQRCSFSPAIRRIKRNSMPAKKSFVNTSKTSLPIPTKINIVEYVYKTKSISKSVLHLSALSINRCFLS